MKHLEPNQFDSLLVSKEKALVMFYADWCPICQIFKPVSESAITTKSTSNGYKFYESKLMMMITHYGIDFQLVLFLH